MNPRASSLRLWLFRRAAQTIKTKQQKPSRCWENMPYPDRARTKLFTRLPGVHRGRRQCECQGHSREYAFALCGYEWICLAGKNRAVSKFAFGRFCGMILRRGRYRGCFIRESKRRRATLRPIRQGIGACRERECRLRRCRQHARVRPPRWHGRVHRPAQQRRRRLLLRPRSRRGQESWRLRR